MEDNYDFLDALPIDAQATGEQVLEAVAAYFEAHPLEPELSTEIDAVTEDVHAAPVDELRQEQARLLLGSPARRTLPGTTDPGLAAARLISGQPRVLR